MVLAPGIVPANRRGIACSAVGSYLRHMDRLEKRQQEAAAREVLAQTSTHLGEVGERLRDLRLKVKDARGFQGNYGPTVLYKFEDADGNALSRFCSSSAELNIGDTVVLDATVKAHSEFRGVAETQLSRAKVKETV